MKEKKISKYLSLLLRHKPEVLGIQLDENGWTDVDELIGKMQAKGMEVDLDLLQKVVQNNDKQRFTFDKNSEKIRANQGHSISINLDLKAQEPPKVLFHGTATKNLPSISEKGLIKGSRQYVHLSTDKATATKVGQRYGKPIILHIDSAQMYKDGFDFYCSKNKVWLTDHVPSHYIKFSGKPPLNCAPKSS